MNFDEELLGPSPSDASSCQSAPSLLLFKCQQGPKSRVFSISGGFGSGIEKKVGYRAGLGRELVLKYSIGYVRVSYFLSGISG